jgi:hypothetical protein
MGEAKRRRLAGEMPRIRTWATGSIAVVANECECFEWSGTKQEAIELQKRFLDVAVIYRNSAHSVAKRFAGYLMVYGMPKAGDVDCRPSSAGQLWSAAEVEICRAAVLWLALREHIPNSGQKIEDIFVGKALAVMFNGDKELILESTLRDLRGEPIRDGHDFTMTVGVREHRCRLDPRNAVSMPEADLFALAGKPLPGASGSIYVPRVPIDAAEADAMLRMLTVVADATDPSAEVRTYAGYTNEELAGGRPHVRIR